jgi:hypothetical protein
MRQVEVSRTIVFDAPHRARSFFEALIADNLDLGRPENVEIIFGRRVRCDIPGTFRATIDRPLINGHGAGPISSFVERLPTPPNGVSYRTCARPRWSSTEYLNPSMSCPSISPRSNSATVSGSSAGSRMEKSRSVENRPALACVQLAKRGATLEDQMVEYPSPVQACQQQVLRNVDQGSLPAAGALWGVASQPADGDAAHAISASVRGSNGRSPSATLKRLSKRWLVRERPNHVTDCGLAGCRRSATPGATPLRR